MQLQSILLNNILLISICIHVQAIPILRKYYFIIENSSNTNGFNLQTDPSLCISDNNILCDENKYECQKGWLTLDNNKLCSYKQISKSFTFILSLFVGSAGIDWFVLSRKNSLYILTGLLKFLLTLAAGVWNRMAKIRKIEKSMTMADYLGASLSFIGVIWWFIDWIRILFNIFPDGNGAPLS